MGSPLRKFDGGQESLCVAVAMTAAAAATQDTGKFRTNTNDQFYTKPEVAAACVARIISIWPDSSGARWIEPSAGKGAFLEAAAAHGISAIGLDIAPAREGILATDFLTWSPSEDEEDCLLFGNPPFGRQGSSAKAFIARGGLFARRIAFILPRSFLKPSMTRAFPLEFHCCWSEELAADSFLVNGLSYAVPCVFQMWERRPGIPRALEAAVEPQGFLYVKGTEQYDLAIRRVGVYAGKATVATAGVTPSVQSHYFVRLTMPGGMSREELAAQISAHEFPSNTTGPRSLTKGEVSAVVNAILMTGSGDHSE
jgi:hypothetical protein